MANDDPAIIRADNLDGSSVQTEEIKRAETEPSIGALVKAEVQKALAPRVLTIDERVMNLELRAGADVVTYNDLYMFGKYALYGLLLLIIIVRNTRY